MRKNQGRSGIGKLPEKKGLAACANPLESLVELNGIEPSAS